MTRALALSLVALVSSACADFVPLTTIGDASGPAPFQGAALAPLAPLPRTSVALPSPLGPPARHVPQCGERVLEGRGTIIDLAVHDGKIALATTSGLLLQGEGGAFGTVDDQLAWRLRSAGGSLYASTSTEYTWDSFSLVRFDEQFARTVLLAPADLHALAAANTPVSTDGTTPHTVVADFALMGDQLVFTGEDTAMIDHEAVVAGSSSARLYTMPPDASAPPTSHASMPAAGELEVDGDSVFVAGVGIDRYDLAGSRVEIFEQYGITPQRLVQTDDALFFTSGIDGAVVRVAKATGQVHVIDHSASHWDADVRIEGDRVYWLEIDFDGFPGIGRIRRAPIDGGDAELLLECAAPSRLLIHEGYFYVATSGDDPALMRVPLPG